MVVYFCSFDCVKFRGLFTLIWIVFLMFLSTYFNCVPHVCNACIYFNFQCLIYHSICSKNVKFSHTRYRALGPELIPVYRQSTSSWLFSHPPGSRLAVILSARPVVTFPGEVTWYWLNDGDVLRAEERHRSSTSTKLNCLVTEADRCEQLAQGCYADGHGDTRPHNLNVPKSNALPISYLRHRHLR